MSQITKITQQEDIFLAQDKRD